MAVPSTVTIEKLNDQYVEISGLADGLTGTLTETATVTVTLKDYAGAAVAPINGLALAAVPGTPGTYRGLVEDSFDPPKGVGYVLHIDATDGGSVLHMEIPTEAKVRVS